MKKEINVKNYKPKELRGLINRMRYGDIIESGNKSIRNMQPSFLLKPIFDFFQDGFLLETDISTNEAIDRLFN